MCQDFTHLMISALRGFGLPARYVSGYIRTRPSRGARRLGADQSHAWVGCWLGPEHGWVDLDPTNGIVVRDEHVVLGWGRDFGDVTPLRGVILGGGEQTLSVEVDCWKPTRDNRHRADVMQPKPATRVADGPMTILNVVHRTRYRYAEPVTFGPHRLMMRPRDSHDLRLIDTALTIAPARIGALAARRVRQLGRDRRVRGARQASCSSSRRSAPNTIRCRRPR